MREKSTMNLPARPIRLKAKHRIRFLVTGQEWGLQVDLAAA